MSLKRKIKIKIGELLLDKGAINKKQLEEALDLQRTKYKRKKLLGEILVELGYLEEEGLYSVLATQLGYPYIKIVNCKIDKEVLSLIPKKLVESSNVIPIDKIGNILTLAMLNPLEEDTINKIEQTTGLKVKIFVTTLSDLKEAALMNYGAKKS